MQSHQPGEVILPHDTNPTDVPTSLPSVDDGNVSLPESAPSSVPQAPVLQAEASDTVGVPSQPTENTPPPPPVASQSELPEPPQRTEFVQPVWAPIPKGTSATSLTWEAAEYIHHHKTPAWFGWATVLAAILSVAIYFLNRDIITAVIVFLAIVGLVFFSARTPLMQQYEMDTQGVRVGRKEYDFADFRSFSITAETPSTRSIILTPLKRFMPYITINLPPEQEETAANILGAVLPMDQARGDAVDSFMRRLHF